MLNPIRPLPMTRTLWFTNLPKLWKIFQSNRRFSLNFIVHTNTCARTQTNVLNLNTHISIFERMMLVISEDLKKKVIMVWDLVLTMITTVVYFSLKNVSAKCTGTVNQWLICLPVTSIVLYSILGCGLLFSISFIHYFISVMS